jgi:hypothetical protein
MTSLFLVADGLFGRLWEIEPFPLRLSKLCAEWVFQNPLFDRLFCVTQGSGCVWNVVGVPESDIIELDKFCLSLLLCPHIVTPGKGRGCKSLAVPPL